MRFHPLCAAMTLGLAGAAAQAQFAVGPNINITRSAGNQAEAAIAVNPTNTQNLFMAVNSASANALQGAISTNGGVTWINRQMATGADGLAAACCDPSCAFDSFGNLFVCYINSSINAIVVGLSTNSGATFTPLATFNSASVDQPTLTVGANTVWVTYNVGGTINARGAPVTALGTVGAFTAAQTAGGGNFGDIAIGPTGAVIVAYENPSGGQGPANIFVNTDANGLAAPGFAAAVNATSTNVGGFDFIPAQPNRSVDAEAGFAWDRSGGPFNGRLYMVYTEENVNESNDMDILVRISPNNGTSWGAPTRVHVANVRSQFLPKIAMDQATGHFAVVWYDARNDPANVRSELWGTASIDGGATYLPEVKISTGVSQSTTAGSGIDFGDYIGLTMHNDAFWPIWADNSNSTGDNPNGVNGALDQYTAKVTILFGSCCIAGNCTRTIQSQCTGTWANAGVCTPNPCVVVNGACCTAGACSVTTQGACAGLWTSGGNCSPSLCAPANDLCGSSNPALSVGVTLTGSNVNSTTNTTIVDTTICGQTTAANSSLDVFWQFTAPATAVYTVDTCGSSFDTVLTVHTACPATDSNKIACNDDSNINTACASGGFQSRIPTVTLSAGSTYTMRVAGFAGGTGAISITVNFVNAIGACCALGVCSLTDAANCTTTSLFSAGSVCSPNVCLTFTGACCTGSHCATTTIPGCAGTFQGFTVACGPPANPTTCCPANFNGINGVDLQDIFDFLTAWFISGPGSDFNHDMLVNITDIFNFLSSWFAGCA